MKKGIYAMIESLEDSSLNLRLLFSDGNELYTIEKAPNLSIMKHFDNVGHWLECGDRSKYTYVTVGGFTYNNGINNIKTIDELVMHLAIFAKAASIIEENFYSCSGDKVIYTNDPELSLTEDYIKDSEYGAIHKTAADDIQKPKLSK